MKNLISQKRASKIASEWHGGQCSALYSLASTGEYFPQLHLKYLQEICEDLQPEYFANYPAPLTKVQERELNSLIRWIVFKGEEKGIFTTFAKHPQYGYTVPFVDSSKTSQEMIDLVDPILLRA